MAMRAELVASLAVEYLFQISIPSLFLMLTTCTNAASIAKRDVKTSSTLQIGWSYSGYYTDNNKGIRQLSRDGYRDYNAMTEETFEYFSECYCDFQLASTSVKKSETDCNMPCSGDSTEACGGSDRISVFTNGVAAPVIDPGPPGSSSLGCQNDPGPRLLSYRAGVAAGDLKMSVLQCTNACQAAGYSLAGVEYSSECYCDSQLRNTGSSGFDGCNMLCSGNSSEYCGGPNRINVYQASAKPKSVSVMPSGWAEKGCLKDNVLGRALTVNVGVVGGTQNMFVGGCVSACSAAGYPIAGVKYSQECWCESQIRNGGVAASDGCDMPCKGNKAELCGGGNRLNVYVSIPLTLPDSSTSFSTSSTTSTSPTSSSVSTTSSSSTTSKSTTSSVPSFTSSSVRPTTSSTAGSFSSSSTTSKSSTSSTASSTTSSTPSSTTSTTSSSSTKTSTITTTHSSSTTAASSSSSKTSSSSSSSVASANRCRATITGGFRFTNPAIQFRKLLFQTTIKIQVAQLYGIIKQMVRRSQSAFIPSGTSNRQAHIYQSLTGLPIRAARTVTFYAGRLDSATKQDNAKVYIAWGDAIMGPSPVCGSSTYSCLTTYSDAGGYRQHTFTFTPTTANGTLSIGFSWDNGSNAAPVIIDDITVS
ncbi:WSC domain-containing protein [Colletotrichum godetiae]|uniref:WSC domain-containing protein n=1 Tax=Colletotrichum godetiae TaxID=1209918 RepID=A0AAJ0EV10_9PEZI|nr:WSC domain-containing protein [Colletotrichum godetiae]KAK1676777.1 WSC domain-containing protein [Colletotrichum godetiae]